MIRNTLLQSLDSNIAKTRAMMDADKFGASISQSGIIANFRPIRGIGPILVNHSKHEIDDIIYFYNIYHSDVYGEYDGYSDRITIMSPKRGNTELHCKSGAVYLGADTLYVGSANTFSSANMFSGLNQRRLSISTNRLRKAISAQFERPIDQDIRFSNRLELDEKAGLILSNLVRSFHDGLFTSSVLYDSELALSSLADCLATVLLTTQDHSLSHLYSRKTTIGATWQLRRAVDHMEANFAQPLSAADIAMAANVSVRSLYKMLKDELSTTPFRYLRQLRLQAAHRDLADPENTRSIAQIAHTWGFVNLGEFSSRYFRAFGELPSHTAKSKAIKRGA